MRWGIVVLAAGTSSRMGKPKMTLSWGGTTVLGRVLETLEAAMGDRRPATIVVTGGDEEAVRAEVARAAAALARRFAAAGSGPLAVAARPLEAVCVRNPLFRNGEMMDSLRAGLGSLPPEVERALVVLGDQPQLCVASARAVIEGAERSAAPIVVPVCGGRRGHPWAIARSLWEDLGGSRTARDFLEARAELIEEREADETVLKDLDSPEDYERQRPGSDSPGSRT